MANKPEVRKMDDRISAEFTMVGFLPGQIRFKGVNYDTRAMDLDTAQRLVDAGASFLKKKKKRKE